VDLLQVESKLDAFYFSLKVLETLIIRPEDDKPDNLGFRELSNGNYRLISFDADHAFYPATVGRGSITKEIKLQLKTIVFCFKQMLDAINPDARELFLSLDAYALLKDFLQELDLDYQMQLFSRKEILHFLEHREETKKIWLANALELGGVAELYQRIKRIQAALQDTTVVGHLDLFARIEPLASDYYAKLHQGSLQSPGERWAALLPSTEYKLVVTSKCDRVVQQSILRTTEKAKASLTIINEEQFKQQRDNMRRQQIYHPQLALSELTGIEYQYRNIAVLLQDLQLGITQQRDHTHPSFINAYPFIQEQVLKRLDFAEVRYAVPELPAHFIKSIANNLPTTLRELHLKNCTALEYKHLETILEKNIELQILNLSGCASLEEGWSGMGASIGKLQHLEYLNLSGTNIKVLATYGFSLSWYKLNLPWLRRLILQHCNKLNVIAIDCPKLEQLEIINCAKVPVEQILELTQSLPSDAKVNLDNNFDSLIAAAEFDYTSKQTPAPLIFSMPAKNYVINNRQMAKLNAEQKFLSLIAEGEQDVAEAMLKDMPELALFSGNVTDLSGRTFKNITGFQYAVWALDSHMWEMIRKYLPKEAAREQVKSLKTGSWVAQHGEYASWQNLIDALDGVIKLCEQNEWDAADEKWKRDVGDAQLLLPVHVVNQYCHPNRSFDPCPDFNDQSPLPRSRKTDEGDWFTCTYNGGRLGKSCFAYHRGRRRVGGGWVRSHGIG
jgi:hypothetical protein